MAIVNKGAFSLIELMVVVAIVAVLSAVAVPAYKDYSLSARVATVVVPLQELASRAKVFYNVKGYFPSVTDLGFPVVNPNGARPAVSAATASQIMGPYLLAGTDDSEGLHILGGADQGWVYARVSTSAIGLPTHRPDSQIACSYWVDNGAVKTYCYMWYAETGGASGTKRYGGIDNASTTSGWDYNNIAANVPGWVIAP